MAEQHHDQAPRVIEQFIGQRQVVEPVKVALDATWYSGDRVPHMLMCGPAGVGKTELAKIIAREMGVELKEALGQNLRTGAHMAGFLMTARERDVIFIDEVHELRPEAQTQLYRAMVEQKVFLSGGPFGPTVSVASLPRFSLLAASTDEFALRKPLRDRFEMVLRFSFYSCAELIEILSRRIRQSGPPVEPVVLDLIARRSRGIPRIALKLLEACRRLSRSCGDTTITIELFGEMCRIEQIDELGLDATERSYLKILSSSPEPVRPTTLAVKLGLPLRTIQTVTEEFLVRAGLVDRMPNGRVLTASGLAHAHAIRG